MKRISIYFFCVVALGCVTSSILYRRSEESNEIRLEKSSSEESSEDMISSESEKDFEAVEEAVEAADGNASDERFFVKEEDGYLVIYDRMMMKRYDETTIQMEDLPDRLREKMIEGLYFTDEEELYAFLENYSS